jgi:hypothetical protein
MQKTNYHIALLLWYLCLISIHGQEDIRFKNLKLNEIQIIGSHNSYKIAIQKELWNLIFQEDSTIAYSLQYEHPPIYEQLNLGLRSLEIDLYHDPQGGRYSKPNGLKLIKDEQVINDSLERSKQGFKVFHIQDIDFRSRNILFKNILEEIKNWSEQNKNHIPVIITMNAKDQVINNPNFVIPLKFTKNALDSIDLEIKAVLPKSKLITPDLIKGKFTTLEEAILKNGWPKIDSVRGRFLFVLDETGEKLSDYLNSDGSLTNKVLFVNAMEGNPNAAIRIINDPIKNKDYIKELVKKGYLIRTRADENTIEARKNDYTRFKCAIESGAQIITTDYYLPSKFFESNYKIIFDNGHYVKISSLLGGK